MMDGANSEWVYDGFQQFHAFFAPALGWLRTPSSGGSAAGTTSRPCWCRLGRGALVH